MFNHATLYATNWSSGLILFLGICEISCKCIQNAAPAPQPKPIPAQIEETSLKQQFEPNLPKQPHKLTPPPLPSGSFDSFDSDQQNYNLTESGEVRNKYGVNPYGVINSHDFGNKPGRYAKRYYMSSKENPKKMKKRVERAVANVKNKAGKAFDYDMNMENPYDMGGRPPPGKTERRKKKTNEMMEVTVAIRYKRGATPEMKHDEKKIQRVRREMDSDGHEETLNKLKKRNKKDTRGNKRLAFKTWMSKLVPEHAPHIEKLHDKGIDKLMEQKAHGMKKTYGELFHEHHENKEHEPRHLDIHDEHDGKHEMHHPNHEGRHEPHHFEIHGGQEPHHFEMKDHHPSHEGHHESLRAEMHKGREPNAHEEHEGHPEHFEIHGEHEHEPHHLDKEKIDEEHRLKARKKLLEEMYLKEGKEPSNEIKDKHEAEEVEETPAAQTAAAPVQQAQQQQYQQQLYQQQQNQMYNQQNQQYGNNYGNYGGGAGGGMGGMGMNGMGGMGMGGMGMGGMGMGGMGMNGMGGMGMNGMGMGMNGMGMGQMGGFGAILNAVNNNLPKLSQTQTPQAQGGGNYGGPQGTQQNYGGQNPNYGGPNYPQSPAAGPDPNVQAAQDAAAAQQKTADDQEAQVQQPDPQDSTGIQDNKDQDTSQDSSANAKADGSEDDIKADNSNGNDDLNMPSEDAINAQQDNAAADEQNPPLGDLQQNPQIDQGQQGQFGHYDTGVNSANMAAAVGG